MMLQRDACKLLCGPVAARIHRPEMVEPDHAARSDMIELNQSCPTRSEMARFVERYMIRHGVTLSIWRCWFTVWMVAEV
jgi:hypothetical protein